MHDVEIIYTIVCWSDQTGVFAGEHQTGIFVGQHQKCLENITCQLPLFHTLHIVHHCYIVYLL